MDEIVTVQTGGFRDAAERGLQKHSGGKHSGSDTGVMTNSQHPTRGRRRATSPLTFLAINLTINFNIHASPGGNAVSTCVAAIILLSTYVDMAG